MGRWSERLAGRFLAFVGVSPGARVLDVGCGTGVLTKAVAEAGAMATGIDASEPYLSGARRHRSHPNIAYEHGDIRRMRFADGAFDAAVSTLVLDVLGEVEQVVAEMQQVVYPAARWHPASMTIGDSPRSTRSWTPAPCSTNAWPCCATP